MHLAPGNFVKLESCPLLRSCKFNLLGTRMKWCPQNTNECQITYTIGAIIVKKDGLLEFNYSKQLEQLLGSDARGLRWTAAKVSELIDGH